MPCKHTPDHLFVSFDGNMYDTRDTEWSRKTPLRTKHVSHCLSVSNMHDLKACLRAGDTTNVGAYPLFFITGSGDALSFDSVRDNLKQVIAAYATGDKDWCVVGCQVNYEDVDLCCAHSGRRIPAAYNDVDSPCGDDAD